MSDRHRHDEFIWALIFSLIINLLFVFALLAPRQGKKSLRLQPFVVAITPNHTTHLGESSPASLGANALSPPAKRKETVEPPPVFRPQNIRMDPVVPTQDDGFEETIRSVIVAERAVAESAPPSSLAAGAGGTAAIAKETAADKSILGDKMAGDYYTAPEYLGGEKPPYPKRAERNSWEGTVLLSLSINASGEVEKVGIVKTSGYELLDQQARASVSTWRFKPARRNGIALAVTVQQPIIFRSTPPENSP